MGQFKDSEGRTWTIAVTVMTLRRVKRDTADKENGFDGIDLTQADVITTLGDDIYALGSVLYSLCQTEAEKRGLSEEEFADGFADGDVIQEAVECLTAGLVSFTRPASKRQALVKALKKRAEWTDKTMEAQSAVLDGTLLDESFERAESEMKEELQQQFGKPSTPTPDSSNLTPDP